MFILISNWNMEFPILVKTPCSHPLYLNRTRVMSDYGYRP